MELVLSVVQVVHLRDADLPGAPALGEGRRALGRLRRRHRRRPARRRLARRAQPRPLDDRLRDRLRGQHDHPAEDLLAAAQAIVEPVTRNPSARSAGQTTPHGEAPAVELALGHEPLLGGQLLGGVEDAQDRVGEAHVAQRRDRSGRPR